MLISVHLPKTAGISFRNILNNNFKESLLSDYGDIPLNTETEVRNKKALQDAIKSTDLDLSMINCIHGHFMPLKYLPLKNSLKAKFVTWLRDPMARMISHYYFWKRSYNTDTIKPALHRRVIEENWSLEDFCFSEQMQNVYCKFLWAFPINYFDFIGITEFFNQDIKYFTRSFMNNEIYEIPQLNAAPTDQKKQIPDKFFAERFRSFHADDYRIYKSALEIRETNINK
jgi:hypothetical protein